MKKIISVCLVLIMLFLACPVYAQRPSSQVERLFSSEPFILMNTNVDISTTVYPVIIKYYEAFLIMGLGNNFDLDQLAVLYLDNMYQLVRFTFPIYYPQNVGVMAIFFGSGIWIRTGMVHSDGTVTFDMTEIYGDEVEMFVFSNYDS